MVHTKKARDAAWQVLIDNNVESLPIGVVDVACKNQIRIIKNSLAKELQSGEVGVSIFDGKQWYIVYDDTQSLGRKRFTIAHELGHYFLHREMLLQSLKEGYITRTVERKTSPIEIEANIFASRILAPACVLWAINACDADVIAQVCEISQQAAKIRAERLKVLAERGKFLTSPLERQAFAQFSDFIKRYNDNKK